MPIKGLEKGDGVWGRGKEPFLKKVFPSFPRLPYQPLSGTKQIKKASESQTDFQMLCFLITPIRSHHIQIKFGGICCFLSMLKFPTITVEIVG